ncbi:hypothetical protein P4050_14525 [Pseudomonas aeruginosa]|nr:hypothetical protein [Pseudomonas aeruginosa]
MMVVAHTAETTVPSPAGGVLQLGRDQQAEIKVVDANAVELASAALQRRPRTRPGDMGQPAGPAGCRGNPPDPAAGGA